MIETKRVSDSRKGSSFSLFPVAFAVLLVILLLAGGSATITGKTGDDVWRSALDARPAATTSIPGEIPHGEESGGPFLPGVPAPRIPFFSLAPISAGTLTPTAKGAHGGPDLSRAPPPTRRWNC